MYQSDIPLIYTYSVHVSCFKIILNTSPVFGSIPNTEVVSSILYVISASKVPTKSASVALISCTNVPTPEFSEIAVIKN